MDIKTMLKSKTWAVVGATNKVDRFGYKILKHLQACGKTVYPVHPKLKEIDEIKVYSSIEELPVVPDVAVFVVSEKIGINVLDECKCKGIKNIWLQPGADEQSVIDKANKLGFNVIKSCVLVEMNEEN